MFRERIPAYKWLVGRYYATVLAFFVGLLALVTDHTPLAIICFYLWLLLTLALMSERLADQRLRWASVKATFLTSLATPFLSVYWRLYGAFSYRVWYL